MSNSPAISENTFNLSMLIDMEDPYSVMDEVKTIVRMTFSDFDFSLADQVFNDMIRLFRGKYPGYQKCNTQYHDLNHTSDALLSMARLMHGAILAGEELSRENITLGIISALMHDTGYIQTIDDTTGTGAKYTLTHIQRSIDFMQKYFSENGHVGMQYKDYSDILNCTGLRISIGEIIFRTYQMELLGKMLGTADLVGQIADRIYLEKLPSLYHEFQEGNIRCYKNEYDFFLKTIDFYELTQKRLEEDLGGVTKYFPLHFKSRFSIEIDLYQEAMKNNMDYLKHLLKHHKKNYRKHLKRNYW